SAWVPPGASLGPVPSSQAAFWPVVPASCAPPGAGRGMPVPNGATIHAARALRHEGQIPQFPGQRPGNGCPAVARRPDIHRSAVERFPRYVGRTAVLAFRPGRSFVTEARQSGAPDVRALTEVLLTRAAGSGGQL